MELQGVDYVKAYDFGNVTCALMKRGKSEAEAGTAVDHLRSFMLLSAMHPSKEFAAWNILDEAWHEFIVRTPEYAVFCENAFGHFLHHDADAFGTPAFRAAWTETVALVKAHFGIELEEDPDAGDAPTSAATCMFVRAATCMVLRKAA